MIPNPNQLRIFAQQWRNIAEVAKDQTQVLREHDVPGWLVAQALTAESHSLTAAAQLEDMADHIESIEARAGELCVR